MNRPLILTYDVGTQSTRAILVDKQGNIVDKEQVKYAEPYFRQRPGWAEQKTDFYFDNMCKASTALMARNADKVPDIIACAVTVIRDTLVFLDENYQPTRDIIHWLDARKCVFDDPFPLWKEAVFELIGMGKGTRIAYRTSKVNWVRQKQPKVWARTKKIVCLPAFMAALCAAPSIPSAIPLTIVTPDAASSPDSLSAASLPYTEAFLAP